MHLIYDIRTAPEGVSVPNVIKSLGITYKAETKYNYEGNFFWGSWLLSHCENVPKPLPSFLTEQEGDFIDFAVNTVGLHRTQAESIRDYVPAEKVEGDKSGLKPIDMEVLMCSGIDCEFSDDGDVWVIGKLTEIQHDFNRPYYTSYGGYAYCRPRQDHLHSWLKGGECPLPDGFMVRVYSRNIELARTEIATALEWGHRILQASDNRGTNAACDNEIVYFAVLPELADGFCMPSEE